VILQESESGKKPKMGDKLKVHYTGYFKDGKIFDSSVERNSPIEFPIGKGMVIKGWDEGLMLLHEGEKAKLIIPFHLAYGENGRGPIPPQSDLIFDVELLEIIEAIKPLPYSIEGKRIIETNSGLKYYVVAEGNGLKPVKGNKVKVHYTGYFENGEIFDSSVERGFPFEFEVGQGKVIKGWDEGLLLMKQGGKSRFLIPHQLAYGENTIGPIPGKSMLTFDVELIEVKN
jgi:peptidylprolyl isomerase